MTKPLSERSERDDGLLLHWYPLCILYLHVDEVELLSNFPNRNQANCDDKICSKIKTLLIFKTTFQIRFYGTIESEMFWWFRGWVGNVSQVEWEQLTSPWYKYWSAIILFSAIIFITATAVLNDGNNYSGKRGNKSDIVSGFTSIYNWIAPPPLTWGQPVYKVCTDLMQLLKVYQVPRSQLLALSTVTAFQKVVHIVVDWC